MTFNGRGATTFPPDDVDAAIVALGVDVEDIAEITTPAELATAVADHAALVAATGVHGRVKQVLVDGQDETSDATITVTGLAVGDALVSFIVLATKAAIATAATRALTDFTISANTLTIGANAANNTNNQYLITYIDAA